MQIRELLQAAEQLKAEIITDRRTLHQNPEAGPRLPETAGYVKRQLEALGYPAQELAGGVAADITGEDTGRCILLRADMDALRIREDTGLEFQSENGKMHACGHDLHAAMLLGAAQLRCLPRGALILDLASRPGGTDFAAARELGLRAEHALSLPARCAPETAGALVAHTVEVILQERAATARSERGVS